MGRLDDAEKVNLAERAEELAAEAEEIRKRFSVPAETPGRRRTDDAEIDRTLSESLRTLRRIAGR